MAVAGNDITFTDPLLGWPNLIANGIGAADLTHAGGVQKDSIVTNVARGHPNAGQTTVTFSSPVTAQANDLISFCPVKHQNLIKRWRYYLRNELDASNHTNIQKAILTALTDTSVTSVTFQAFEDTAQRVLVETILATTDADDDNLDPTHKSLSIALLTVRTNAPDPIDTQ